MSLSGVSCLVTGAGGFIGSHLTESLVREGARVRALVHYNALNSAAWLDDSAHRGDIDVVFGDVTDPDSMERAVEDVEIVFHLAALIAIPYSYLAPEAYVHTNVLGTLNVIRASHRAGARRVVHTSTSEVYGSALVTPIAESHPLQAQSPYAASKIGADKIAEAMHLSFEAPVVTIRPFNTFGPRQSARAVLPTVITQCLSGDVVRLGSLHPTRDFTFVADTARAFRLAAEAPDAIGKTINLGTGREVSVGEMAETIARLIGVKLRLECDSERVRPTGSEVTRLVADNSLARRLLSWEPRHTLEEGLDESIAWFRTHIGRYRPGTYNV
ncbi:MAG: SDR family NAD(P)-dependent oxidoreductase [Gemmatimonadaceae bacterium]